MGFGAETNVVASRHRAANGFTQLAEFEFGIADKARIGCATIGIRLEEGRDDGCLKGLSEIKHMQGHIERFGQRDSRRIHLIATGQHVPCGDVKTLLLQEAIFVIFFDIMGISEFIVKLIAAVLVIILNYFISKLIVFRKKRTQS